MAEDESQIPTRDESFRCASFEEADSAPSSNPEDVFNPFFNAVRPWNYQEPPASQAGFPSTPWGFDDMANPHIHPLLAVPFSQAPAYQQLPAFHSAPSPQVMRSNDGLEGQQPDASDTGMAPVAIPSRGAQESFHTPFYQSMPHQSSGSASSLDFTPDRANEEASSRLEPPARSPMIRRKRKRTVPDDDEEGDAFEEDGNPVKRNAHNMIEKRYRNNLNDKIIALRESVPALRIMTKSARGEDITHDREELQGLTPAHKINKATILGKATEYIHHLEKRNQDLVDENSSLQAKITAYEKMCSTTPASGNGGPSQFSTPPVQYPFPSDAIDPVYPETRTDDHFPMVVRQQQIQQQRQAPPRRWNLSPYAGRVMMGSFAGLMIVEAVRETERSDDAADSRGLLAVPGQLVARLLAQPLELNVRGYCVHVPFQLLAVLGIILWILVPSILMTNTKPGILAPAKSTLQPAPSLASCIQVRRHAWLTAVRTVWVPRHNFFLEAAALLLKTFKLSVRNVVGVRAFRMVTGLTEEQEAARVHAWSIALDSQLAGGDVEINKSRLVLTLLASGTLPATPRRLMLKALHIRVLLWDMGCRGLAAPFVKGLASKLAGDRWREAREMNRLLAQLSRCTGSADTLEDELPDHLATLVSLGCDEVLTDQVVQRAYNLAYHLPTAANVQTHIDGMDYVVEDGAITCPLDAVAAWWATEKLQRFLTCAVTGQDADPLARLDMLTRVKKACPVHSAAQLRIAGAQAIWSCDKQSSYVREFAALLGADRTCYFVNGSSSGADEPPSRWMPDLELTCACAAIIKRTSQLCWSDEMHPSDLLRGVHSILATPSTDGMTLLGYAAVFGVMSKLYSCAEHADTFKSSLETMASTLRVWIGGSAADTSGLSCADRYQSMDLCLAVTKSLWESGNEDCSES